jgi:hypothetical protein
MQTMPARDSGSRRVRLEVQSGDSEEDFKEVEETEETRSDADADAEVVMEWKKAQRGVPQRGSLRRIPCSRCA